jgi:hypothetical protein
MGQVDVVVSSWVKRFRGLTLLFGRIQRAKHDFGINERSLQRAREKMGIVATKAGYQGAWVRSY